jgi:hypothetical protein
VTRHGREANKGGKQNCRDDFMANQNGGQEAG